MFHFVFTVRNKGCCCFVLLQEGLEYMTSGQLLAISDRLKYFTKQNLHNVLSRIPTKTFKDSLAELNVRKCNHVVYLTTCC